MIILVYNLNIRETVNIWTNGLSKHRVNVVHSVCANIYKYIVYLISLVFFLISEEYACNVTMRGHKEKRGEEEFLKFDPFKVKLRVGQSSIFLTNLFDGDPVLGPATNRVINENSQLFLQEISPVLERSLADLFTEMANKITSKFTYKELFP